MNAQSAVSHLHFLVSDIPRHVEARSAIAGGRAQLFGLNESGVAVLEPSTRGLSIIGDVAPEAVAGAVHATGDDGSVFGDPALHLDLDGWTRGLALIYEQRAVPSVATDGTRLVDIHELLSFDLPVDLAAELIPVATYARIAATFVDGRPVSICTATETETLFDIGIDTLEGYRGRGHAVTCAAFMIAHQLGRGRRPVWGAMQDNRASQRVAEKLGFVPIDRLAVWER
jgi:GNAT superfamily N-acetyltransferase